MKAQLRHTVNQAAEPIGDRLYVWCPGCELGGGSGLHGLPIAGSPGVTEPFWTWNGDIEAPTLEPSIMTRYNSPDGKMVCHSYLRAGRWEFLGDSTHALAGQTVDLPDLPEWMVKS